MFFDLFQTSSRSWNPDEEVGQPEPEAGQQPREPRQGLQQEALAHPLSPGNLSIYLSIQLSNYLSIYLSIYPLHIHIYLSTYLFIYFSR